MAELFETISLEWNGSKYPLTPTLEDVGKVESVITLTQLMRAMQESDPPFVKIARGYGVMLRAAGAKVDDEDVYRAMFGVDNSQRAAFSAISALLVMMIPKNMTEGEAKKPQAQEASGTS